MYLIDTNIFLEILLKRNKSDLCKKFLRNNLNQIFISDFSLHSLGVILSKYNQNDLFIKFVEDSLPNLTLVTLPVECYKELIESKKMFGIDFDDSYQYNIAKYFHLKIVTLDNDFKKMKDIETLFL
jgi:uncharacterized protein